ncbi:DUF6247 family protein [Streptomyces sp. NPDC088348]|uniref:DUF6247 family protein n=1 Tax=Streptomyces sp. NPDC088348 TaxID=3365853 RepID=UPI0037F2F82F
MRYDEAPSGAVRDADHRSSREITDHLRASEPSRRAHGCGRELHQLRGPSQVAVEDGGVRSYWPSRTLSHTWVPAFERDWAKALEDSRHSYSLTPLHDVVRAWQLRVATAPAVDAYMDSGRDESGFVDLADILAAR